MAIAEVDVHRWTREEYERLGEAGFLPPEARLELIDGLIYHLAPQTSFHSTAVRAAQEALRQVFREGFDIRGKLPLALGADSEPESDIAVVRGSIRDFRDHHPTTAVLVVEVADTSLLHDRKRKTPLYARAGIPEYWILNLIRRSLEVYREPGEGAYRSRTTLRAGAHVTPLAQPSIRVPIDDLLP